VWGGSASSARQAHGTAARAGAVVFVRRRGSGEGGAEEEDFSLLPSEGARRSAQQAQRGGEVAGKRRGVLEVVEAGTPPPPPRLPRRQRHVCRRLSLSSARVYAACPPVRRVCCREKSERCHAQARRRVRCRATLCRVAVWRRARGMRRQENVTARMLLHARHACYRRGVARTSGARMLRARVGTGSGVYTGSSVSLPLPPPLPPSSSSSSSSSLPPPLPPFF